MTTSEAIKAIEEDNNKRFYRQENAKIYELLCNVCSVKQILCYVYNAGYFKDGNQIEVSLHDDWQEADSLGILGGV